MEIAKQEKSITELLKQLADLEFNNKKVQAIIFAKRGSRLVANKVNDMKECIEEKANEYGRKIEYVQDTSKLKSAIEANILRNYTLSLERVNKEFDNKYKGILEEIMELENMDTNIIIVQDHTARKRDEEKAKPEYAEEQKLKEDAKLALEDGDYDKLEGINKRLKEISKINKGTELEKKAKNIRADRAKIAEAIKLCYKELENCESERRTAMELIAGKKENLLQTADKKYLLVLEKQGFLQKAWGMLMNKINGSKRYTENVTNVLTQKVDNIENNAIPNLRKKLQKEIAEIREKTQKTVENVKDIDFIDELPKPVKSVIQGIDKAKDGAKAVGEGIVDKADELVSRGKETGQKIAETVVDTSKRTYNGMISGYRSTRMWTISKLEERINKLENQREILEAER